MNLPHYVVTEHPENPIIGPRFPQWMIADPTVLLPDETPDGLWHLFANTIPPRIHHFTSRDGVRFRPISECCEGGMRPFVRRFEGLYYLYFEQIRWAVPLRSRIVYVTSTDLRIWSRPKPLLAPSFPWHGRLHRTCGNPCVIPWRGQFHLFYSAATVFLKDCFFMEPRHIGHAVSDSPAGPFIPDPQPVLSPSPSDSFRNLGAGAIKVLVDPDDGSLWGFNNGIYQDKDRHSRSAIRLVHSTDGLEWKDLPGKDLLVPGGTGWKKALVYALDVRLLKEGSLVMFYNARDGWLKGTERIGLANLQAPGPSH